MLIYGQQYLFSQEVGVITPSQLANQCFFLSPGLCVSSFGAARCCRMGWNRCKQDLCTYLEVVYSRCRSGEIGVLGGLCDSWPAVSCLKRRVTGVAFLLGGWCLTPVRLVFPFEGVVVHLVYLLMIEVVISSYSISYGTSASSQVSDDVYWTDMYSLHLSECYISLWQCCLSISLGVVMGCEGTGGY